MQLENLLQKQNHIFVKLEPGGAFAVDNIGAFFQQTSQQLVGDLRKPNESRCRRWI